MTNLFLKLGYIGKNITKNGFSFPRKWMITWKNLDEYLRLAVKFVFYLDCNNEFSFPRKLMITWYDLGE